MTTDIEMLGIALDTSGLKSGQAELRRTAAAGNRAADALDAAGRRGSDGLDKVEKGAGRARVAIGGLSSGIGNLRSVMGALAIAATIKEFSQLSDTLTGIESRMKGVISTTMEMAIATGELVRIADQNRSSLTATATLYTKLAKPIAAIGGGMRETLDVTRAFSAAMLVGGATAQEAAAATLQFAQAMGSGVLRGDEFNSIAEASPRLLQAIADGAGVATGALRGMAEDGMLNASLVSGALLKQMMQLEAEAVAYGATMGGSATQVSNAIGVEVAAFNKATGASAAMANGIRAAIPVVQAIGGAITGLTGFISDHSVVLATLVGGYASYRAALAITAGISAVTAAVSLSTTAYMASTASLGGLTTAFGAARIAATAFLASLGPVGWAIAGLGAAAAGFAAWKMSQKEVVQSTETGAKAIADLQARIKAIDTGPAAQEALKQKSAVDQLVESYRSQGVAGKELVVIRRLATEADQKAASAGDRLLRQAKEQQEAVQRQAEVEKIAKQAADERRRAAEQYQQQRSGYANDIADLRTIQDLVRDGMAVEEARARVQLSRQGALPAEVAALMEQQGIVDRMAEREKMREEGGKLYLDVLKEINQEQQRLAEAAQKSFDAFMRMDVGALGAGFDRVTQSMGTVVDQFARLIDVQEAYAKARNDNAGDAVKLAQMEQKHQLNQMRTYGNLTGAAKGFFKEGSRGYKGMEAAEKSFRITELAMNAKAIAEKLLGINLVTAATVSGEAQKAGAAIAATPVIVGASVAQGTASAAAGVANQAAGDPYTAFPRMAAMAAIMAGLGFAVGGIGGSAKVDPGNTGTGTVFGDSSAQSKSIPNAIDLLADNSSIELRYSAAMLASLRGIEANIGGLTNLLVRLPGLSNLSGSVKVGTDTGLIGKGLDAFSGTMNKLTFGISDMLGVSALTKALGGLFGTKTKITGSGIFAPGQQLADILAGDMDLFNYVDINTKKKSFGVTTSNKNKTKLSAADDLLSTQFELIFQGFDDAIRAAAGPLDVGLGTIDANLQDFVVKIGKINLKGLKGEAIQERLQAVFGAAADRIATAALPGLADFQKVGEGYFETVVRVSAGVEQAGYQLERLHVSAIKYTDIVSKQGDVGAEIVRQSLQAYELASFGFSTGVSQIIAGLEGSAEEISDTYRSLLQMRDGLAAVGKSITSLTVDMIRGAGGVEALQGGLDSYFSDFLTDGERAAEQARRMTREFSLLGLALPASKDAYKDLVRGIDVGTASGQQLFGSVISLAGGFAELQDAMASAAEAQNRLKEALAQERYDGLLPEQQLASLQAQYDAAYAVAIVSTGDQLQKQANIMADLLDPLLKQAAVVYASGEQYQAIRDYTLRAGDNIVGKTAVPGFAAGGMFGGGLRLVGERGPELEVTGPARYWSAEQTKGMMSGSGDQKQVVAELREQNAMLKQMVSELTALVRVQSAGNKQILEKLDDQTEHLAEMSDAARLEASA